MVRKAGCEVTALACGDLHLEHIRSWREEAVGRGLGVRVCYPVWCDDMRATNIGHSRRTCGEAACYVASRQ